MHISHAAILALAGTVHIGISYGRPTAGPTSQISFREANVTPHSGVLEDHTASFEELEKRTCPCGQTEHGICPQPGCPGSNVGAGPSNIGSTTAGGVSFGHDTHGQGGPSTGPATNYYRLRDSVTGALLVAPFTGPAPDPSRYYRGDGTPAPPLAPGQSYYPIAHPPQPQPPHPQGPPMVHQPIVPPLPPPPQLPHHQPMVPLGPHTVPPVYQPIVAPLPPPPQLPPHQPLYPPVNPAAIQQPPAAPVAGPSHPQAPVVHNPGNQPQPPAGGAALPPRMRKPTRTWTNQGGGSSGGGSGAI